jgi:type VI protein secretion system component VasF
MTTPDPQTPRRQADPGARKTRARRGPWGVLALWLAAIAVLFLVGVFARWLQ